VHSFYSSRQPSGENNVVEAELRALRRAGHEVRLIAARTDDLEDQVANRARTALRVASGRGRSPLVELERFGPDVVHVHNLFPNFARRWVEALDAPLVHTVHNYRPLCANYQLLRDGRICTLCPDGDRWAGVRYACYRDSRLATLPIAWANRHGPEADWLLARADRLIMISDLQRQIFAGAGATTERATVWPNFVPAEIDPGPSTDGGGAGWLFVGRLSAEKGILRLLERWPDRARLRVVGDGPERERVAAAAGSNVEVLGNRPRHEILELMRASTGLIFPSLWYEPSATPLVYVEALAAGLPVVALPPSPVVESVREDGTGVVLSWDDELGPALADASDRLHDLRGRCREVFEARHTEEAYLRRARDTYEQVIDERARARP
jgi:glycosyltransferase involved in cell wall biosynthesis